MILRNSIAINAPITIVSLTFIIDRQLIYQDKTQQEE